MPLVAGCRLGAYEVVGPLGAGGMGEVYRARDTRLDRDVAIKILPEAFAADPERLARFEREAKTLASLNHSNIAYIHGIEDSGAVRALVMELVEGEDLAQRLARGPVPLDDVISIARQIADALEAAHERGIVHRDLKPANIRITADGRVKVLDFGLAKAADPLGVSSADAMNSPTFTSPPTQLGVLLGTAAYMAPEQAKGQAIDKRADIWAFGVVLWEMLTGAKLFARDTVPETIALVITHAPRLEQLPASTPSPLRELLARCLERDPKLRLRDIGEARIVLSRPLVSRTMTASSASPARVWILGAVAIVLAAISGFAAWALKPETAAPLRRFALSQATTIGESGALSPDGTRVAYIAGNHLYVRSFDALQPEDLGLVHVTARQPFWSPDGRTLGYAAEGTLRTVPAEGGPVFVVCKIPASGRIIDAVWLPAGDIVFSVWRESLYRVPSSGGQPSVLLAIDPATEIDFHSIALAPGNRLILGTHQRDADFEVAELVDGTQRIVLTKERNATQFEYAAPGFLLFRRPLTNVGIWAVPFSNGPIDVNAATLIEAGAADFDVANDGTLLYALPRPTMSSFVWVDRKGKVEPVAGSPIEIPNADIALSPDGRRAAFIEGTGPDGNVVVRDLQTGADTRLTSNKAQDTGGVWSDTRFPAWFPSGDRILHMVGRTEADRLVVRRSDGAAEGRDLLAGRFGKVLGDGAAIMFVYDDRGRGRLRRAALRRDGTVGSPEPVFPGSEEPNVSDFDVSFDGRLLAFTSRAIGGRLDVFITDLPTARDRLLVTEGGTRPRFSPATLELFFVKGRSDEQGQPGGAFMVVPITNASPVKLGSPLELFTEAGADRLKIMGYAVALDGKRFMMSKSSDVRPGEEARVVLVQNWTAEMKNR